MDAENLIIEPIITEKAVGARVAARYVFKVHLDANKVAIRKAIEKIFKVKVLAVNTCFVRGKKRTLGKSIGRKSNWKKAYVTLAAGQKITELEA